MELMRDITDAPKEGRSTDPARNLVVAAEVQLSIAHVFIAELNHKAPEKFKFRRDKVFWVDLCLTPRRPNSSARFVDHWSPARTIEMGSLIAIPPRMRTELNSAGGRHASLICQMQASAVEKWLPEDFTWTERRLEASLNIASDTIRPLMLRFNHELRNPGPGSLELCESLASILAIELARYFAAASSTDEKGGLASWRMRLIDDRIADRSQPFPSVGELAKLCRLSSRQLGRAFKASRGSSISDFLTQTRIEAAKRKLYSDTCIADISSILGFSSQSSFTAAFRRSTGTTPDQFRKRIRAGSPSR
ncbi:AraC family transcriptional regulator [Novosphingobium aquae]|uniref:AraC family transcriptional regulator n=1 Tax=Novosphingobium aquae TaxID=3133435 RepID=A0ABU8S819_9SPHN